VNFILLHSSGFFPILWSGLHGFLACYVHINWT